MTKLDTSLCGAQAVFWPDEEALDVECTLLRGHQPADRYDADGLVWTEDELYARHPEDHEP